MSATNLDLPILASADQIRRREFVTTRRGYDPDQVRAYLEQLADQVEAMRSMLRDVRSQADAAIRANAQHPDPYERLARRVAGVIREADTAAETIRTEAQTDAERWTHEARAEADRIRTDAQARAEEARARADAAVRSAREEADRTIAGLAMRRDALVDQLASMQERLVGVARDLESAMDVQVSIPDMGPISAILDGASSEAPEQGAGAAAPANGQASGANEPATSPESETEEHEPDDDAPAHTVGTVVVVSDADEPGGGVGEPTVPDPAYEELWEGTDAISLDLPDLPALDLDWGEGRRSDEPNT